MLFVAHHAIHKVRPHVPYQCRRQLCDEPCLTALHEIALPLYHHPSSLPLLCKCARPGIRYWWAELAYLANVIPWSTPLGGCVSVSWYLSNDTMFFVAGVPLVALYHRRPRAAVAAALFIIAASCGFTLVWYGFLQEVRFSIFQASGGTTWLNAYAVPWARCPVYLIGLLCGFLWHSEFRVRVGLGQGRIGVNNGGNNTSGGASTHQDVEGGKNLLDGDRKTVVPRVAAVASAVLLALPVYGSYWAYQDVAELRVSAWADHLYLAFSRPAWALGVALMCGLCFCGRGGFVNWILARPAWITPARLTYCSYLTHPILLTVLYGSRVRPERFTSLDYAVTYMGVAVGTFAGATAMHLLVEAPFRNVESWAMRLRRGKSEL